MMEFTFVGAGLLIGLLAAWVVGVLASKDDYSDITTAYIVQKKNGKFKVTPKRNKLRFKEEAKFGEHNFELRPHPERSEEIKIKIEFKEKKKKGQLRKGPFGDSGVYPLDRSNPRVEKLEVIDDVDPGNFADDWNYTVTDVIKNEKVDPGIRIKK